MPKEKWATWPLLIIFFSFSSSYFLIKNKGLAGSKKDLKTAMGGD
jgi:hypothetical protein